MQVDSGFGAQTNPNFGFCSLFFWTWMIDSDWFADKFDEKKKEEI